MNLSEIFKEALLEAKKKKPSAGLSKKEKSAVVKKAKAGEDIGKKGKGFEKLAAKAAKQYGSKEKGEKVAASAMWKNIKKENVNENINEAFDPESIKAIATALWLAYKTAWGIKVFNNMRPALDALKAAGDDKDKKWEVFKTYAMHLINPAANVFKKLDLGSTKKTSTDTDNPVNEGEDHEVSMAKNSLKSIMKSVADLMQKLGNEERNIPGWIQDHITNAENFIDQAAQGFHELEYHGKEDEDDEDEEGNPMIQPVDEKKLTKAEKAKKEEIIKAIAKKKGGKKNLKGKDYAIATKQSIQSAE